jgi:hypothetical protein
VSNAIEGWFDVAAACSYGVAVGSGVVPGRTLYFYCSKIHRQTCLSKSPEIRGKKFL